jgi:hypothetical protein
MTMDFKSGSEGLFQLRKFLRYPAFERTELPMPGPEGGCGGVFTIGSVSEGPLVLFAIVPSP